MHGPSGVGEARSQDVLQSGAARRCHRPHVDHHLTPAPPQSRSPRPASPPRSRSCAISCRVSGPDFRRRQPSSLTNRRGWTPNSPPTSTSPALAGDAAPTGPGEMATDYGPADRAGLVFLHANGFNARAYRTTWRRRTGCASSPPISAATARTFATDRPRTSWLDWGRPSGVPGRDVDQRVALAGIRWGQLASSRPPPPKWEGVGAVRP